MTTYAKGVILPGQERSADTPVTKLSAIFVIMCTYSPIAPGSTARRENNRAGCILQRHLKRAE